MNLPRHDGGECLLWIQGSAQAEADMWESPEWTCELGHVGNVEEKGEKGVGCSSQEATGTKRKAGNQPNYRGKSLCGDGRSSHWIGEFGVPGGTGTSVNRRGGRRRGRSR